VRWLRPACSVDGLVGSKPQSWLGKANAFAAILQLLVGIVSQVRDFPIALYKIMSV
jgi:hypothetical protein